MSTITLTKKLPVKKQYDVIVCGGVVAGGLAIDSNRAVADVDIKVLQSMLVKDDVMIHFPDEYVPEDKTVVIHGKNAAEIDGGHI